MLHLRQFCRAIDRQAVLEAATRLLVINRGASTSDIAEAAAISRASLHRLFPTRDGLIEAIAVRVVEHVTAVVEALGWSNAYSGVHYGLALAAQRGDVARAMPHGWCSPLTFAVHHDEPTHPAAAVR